MENERLPSDYSSSRYLFTTMVVFFYEFFGTFCLVGVINASKGNAAAVGLTLFFLLLLTGPITGGHMNPAVTIGVFLNRVRDAYSQNKFGSCILQASVMITAQITGALCSMYCFFYMLERMKNGKPIAEDFPHLTPKTENWQQAMLIEAFATFIFVSAILLVKDKRSSMFSASINESGIGFFGCALIALSLVGMIMAAGDHTSASLNPAVSIALTELDAAFLQLKTSSEHFWCIYITGPILGAVISGLCSWGHAAALENHGPMTMAEKEAEEKEPLIEKKNDEEKNVNAQKEDGQGAADLEVSGKK